MHLDDTSLKRLKARVKQLKENKRLVSNKHQQKQKKDYKTNIKWGTLTSSKNNFI